MQPQALLPFPVFLFSMDLMPMQKMLLKTKLSQWISAYPTVLKGVKVITTPGLLASTRLTARSRAKLKHRECALTTTNASKHLELGRLSRATLSDQTTEAT